MKSIIFFILLVSAFSCCNIRSNEAGKVQESSHEESIEIVYGDGFLTCINNVQLGMVHENDTITCEFLFINQGSEPVKIIEYTVSCDCSTLEYNYNDIMVNDTVVISMLIHTKGKRAGEHSSVAVIKTNGKRRFYDLTAYYQIGHK